MLLGIAHARAALAQAWPPFVLVAGLLLLGQIAGSDGLFDAAASRLVRLPGRPFVALLACLGLVLVVTALLNLDTAAVFLTPVLIGVARRRRLAEDAFLYGSVFMANASSLFLPGSNLTNLLVLSGPAHPRPSGGSFFIAMLPVALAASLATAAGLLVLHRRGLLAGPEPPADPALPVRVGAGLLGTLAAAVLMVVLANPALPVLGVSIALVLWRHRRGGYSIGRAFAALGVPALAGLFVLSVALGIAARSGAVGFGHLHSPGAVAGVAAIATVLINNLPAAVLLSSTGHLPYRALLVGLNVGPNLAVTGSLAVLLWWRAARAAGARPSIGAYSRQGVLLAPLAIAAALLAGWA